MGAYLSQPETKKSTFHKENNKYETVSSGMQGWRQTMEDSHIQELDIVPGVHLFGVFDGHGGSEVALYVQSVFKDFLVRQKSFQEKNYKKALIDCFQEIDDHILRDKGKILEEYRQEKEVQSEAGCTAIVLLITQNKFYVANLGDSRAILYS